MPSPKRIVSLPLNGHRRQDKDWEGTWNALSHFLPPILTFPHQGGREIIPLPVLLSA